VSAEIRSRRAGLNPQDAKDRPLYARVLGLQYLRPSGMLCFFFFEGAIALATLLALAELVSWWAVLVLPTAIAVMVKINDVIAGFGARATNRVRARAAVRTAAREAARRAAAASPPPRPTAAPASAPAPPAHYERPVGRAAVPQPLPLPLPQPQPLSADEELRSVEARRRQSAAHRYDLG
jgi:hypothetical protein